MKKTARKTRRQQLAEKAMIAKKHVDAANSLENPLNLALRNYKPLNGDTISLKCNKVGDLNSETLDWIFDLMERNMKTIYEETWGWDPKKKQQELTEPAAWYLIATDSSGKLIGFSHFRFDMDYGEEVLYCYELQIEPTARRKGLGRCLMIALESMALENHMQKVILTVCKKNFIAVPFFHKLGYKLDKTSPPESENRHYVILSKKQLSSSRNATSIEKL
ncbi:N-alpha-acetyltransferase 40 [Venturia canescens]|uniref:N-alpha-acetyltransferase 40 n=1 Tax=Venturia canescens TaxID=32260 RepID=UPI001C9C9887|nr:N-alpha-acetyltransferase 40 [Venturia canescens]